MNAPPIALTLSGRAPDEKTLLDWSQRTAHPVLRALRELVNNLAQNQVQSVTATTTLDLRTDVALVTAASGPVTVTLPPAEVWERRIVVVKTDASANAVTIVGATSPLSVSLQYGTQEVVSDGVRYYPVTPSFPAGTEGEVLLIRDGTPQFGFAPWQMVNATGDLTAPYNATVRVASISATATIKLPAAPRNGEWVRVITTNATDYNVTVDGNGANVTNGILTSASSLLKSNGETATYVYNATDGQWRVMEKFTPKLFPSLATHIADAGTIALWQGDPPGNGGSGLVDSSGNNLTLEYSAGGPGKYCEIGYGQEGFFCDGTNYWRRVGNANDPVLNMTGSMSIGCIVFPSKFAALPMTIMSYGNNAAGDTNNDVLYNLNLKSTLSTGVAVDNFALASHYYETGATVGHTTTDTKAWPFFRPTHLYWSYDSAAGSLTAYVNGFKQSVTTGLTAKGIGGTPNQRVTIGMDSGIAFPFIGGICSVKVRTGTVTDTYVTAEAARCLGIGERGVV